MRIGIIGSGQVGQTLAKGFLEAGHEVMVGSRDPGSQKLQEWSQSVNQKIQTDDFASTAKFAEIIVIATKWDGTQNAIELAQPENFKGKVVIDVTNPLQTVDGKVGLALGFDNSGGEQIQAWLPEAMVVKTLNLIGHQFMVNPHFEDGTPDMFLCGNDEHAKGAVSMILKQFGWERVTDLGQIEGSRLMEPLCILWVKYGSIHNNWNIAWSMLRK